jgi:hypothetical protein
VKAAANNWTVMNDEYVVERTSVEAGQLVMPFYFICDVSASMSGDVAMLNDGVERLRRAIVSEPVVDDVAQICIMSFSDTAKVVMPLQSMSSWARVPRLVVEGGTNYSSAFRLLAQTIGEDTAYLKRSGYKVYRPCAFFLTDGEPLDRDWLRIFTETLTYDYRTGSGLKSYPIFVPFGFRDAPELVLRRLAYPPGRGRWFHAKSEAIEQALAAILDLVMATVVRAGLSAGTGQPTIPLELRTPDPMIASGGSGFDADYV